MSSAVERAAHWAARLTLDDIPDDVRKVARDCFIDTLGVALAGAARPVTGKVRAVAEAQYGAGECDGFRQHKTDECACRCSCEWQLRRMRLISTTIAIPDSCTAPR